MRQRARLPRGVHGWLVAVVASLAAATAVGLAFAWPGPIHVGAAHIPPYYGAVVREVVVTPCVGLNSAEGLPGRATRCDSITISMQAGPDRGHSEFLVIDEGPGEPKLHQGDQIVVSPTGVAGQYGSYGFVDFRRGHQLVVLAAAFALLVVLVGRFRGIGALVGLVLSWLVLIKFVIPALLAGESPLLIAVLGSAAIVIVVLYVAHGVSARTSTALVGTLASLGLTGALGALAAGATAITGLSSEENRSLLAFAGQINIHGLLLAGIIIGSLGVLNDVTVTQASAVWEIWGAQPRARFWEIYRAGMRVGRDHIASTVYTLVLAYAGAALPLLLLFAVTGQRFSTVVSSDLVAVEVVRALVGSLGLVAAVPLTTALAALVVRSAPASA